MSKAARGTKRLCQGCGGKFYDLNRNPIVCPLCGEEFVISSEEEEDRALAEEKAAAERAAAEQAKKVAPAVVPEAEDIAEDIDDELASLADEDTDEPLADDADAEPFLETEVDDDSDVTGIIGAQIPTDEEDS